MIFNNCFQGLFDGCYINMCCWCCCLDDEHGHPYNYMESPNVKNGYVQYIRTEDCPIIGYV